MLNEVFFMRLSAGARNVTFSSKVTKTRHCVGLPQAISIPTIGNPPLRKQASGLKCGLVWAGATLVTFNESAK